MLPLLILSAALAQAPAVPANAHQPPPEALKHKQAGLEFDHAGEFEKAIEEYDIALDLDPEYDLVFYDRGVVHAEMEDYGSAIRDYKRAIELNPSNWMYQDNMSVALHFLHRDEESVPFLLAAKQLKPSEMAVRQNLGAYYCNTKQYEKAVVEFQELLAIDPEWNMARGCLIDALIGLH